MRGEGRFAGRWPRPLAILASAAAVLVLSMAVGSAGAHKVGFETNLQLKVSELSRTVTQLSGKVVSPKGKCVRGRAVNVSINGLFVGRVFSTFNGFWLLNVSKPAKGSTVVAFTPKKFLKKSRKHKHKCRPDSSQKKAN